MIVYRQKQLSCLLPSVVSLITQLEVQNLLTYHPFMSMVEACWRKTEGIASMKKAEGKYGELKD